MYLRGKTSNAYGLLVTAALVISSNAGAQTWQEVYQPSSNSSGTWEEIECKSSAGWSVCERQEPVEECRGFARDYNMVRMAGKMRSGTCSPRVTFVWDGNHIPNPYSGYSAGGLINMINAHGITFEGYRYYSAGGKSHGPQGVRCSGKSYTNPTSFGICRINVD